MAKTILITGASRGIGRSIALRFAQPGNHLILIALKNTTALEETADLARAAGADCLTLLGDVSDPSFIDLLNLTLGAKLPKIDILVNNAGISHVGLFTDMRYEQWQEILGTNLTGIFLMSQYAARNMLKHHEGVIINISSVWGLSGASMEVAYSATKGGVHAFTQALAKELGPSHIRVNAIACGAIDTDMNRWLSTEDRESFEDQVPLSRFGLPEEVADLVYYLASDKATYLTGEVIRLDGGLL